jgi:hypothetical protein
LYIVGESRAVSKIAGFRLGVSRSVVEQIGQVAKKLRKDIN